MKLNEFLKDKNHVFWDFSNDCNCEDYIKIDDVIEKYFIYKSTSNNTQGSIYENGRKFAIENSKKYMGIKDPDTNSPLLQEIYKILWKDICNKQWMVNLGKIQADTMTSAQYTFNKTVREKVETEEEKKVRKCNQCSLNYCIHLYATAPEEFQRRLLKVKGLELFLSMYHTIGNFIPTPYLFNGARSGMGKYDYWDLTLLKIREWYLAESVNAKEKILLELLQKKEKGKEECKKWLEYYGEGRSGIEGWKNFIVSNYLQDFVKGDEYELILFCKNHAWENPEIEDCVEFFLTVSQLIYLRGKRLMDALNEKK